MATYNTGLFIKQMRINRNITQEKLCHGICETSTLSRIERGIQTPSSYVFQALLGRLGLYSDKYQTNFLCKKDFEQWQSKEALSAAILRKDILEARVSLAELENHRDFECGLNLQYILNCKVSIYTLEGFIEHKFDESMRMLQKSIKITIPDFKEEDIEDYMMNTEEIRAVNLMAGLYFHREDYENATRICFALKKSLDKFVFDINEKARHYPNIVTNLSLLLYRMKKYENAISMCTLCRNFCIESNTPLRIPNILYVHGRCLAEMGENEAEAKVMLRDAYYSARALGQQDVVEEVSEYYRQTLFGEDIEKN